MELRKSAIPTENPVHFDDYETLPSFSSASTHMVAGAFAGIGEHAVMYPIDVVKTRMQSLNPIPMARYRSVPEALYKIIKNEGMLRTVRGMPAVISGAGPAHALYFSCYEKMKCLLSGTPNGMGNPAAHATAGALATLLHDAIMSPADVIKQRMQMYNSPYRTCLKCFLSISRTEGPSAFFRSYTTQLSMNVPFQTIHFMTYEFCQDYINTKRCYNPLAHMVSGAISGAFAAAITTPLDVMKTLLNTQEARTLDIAKQARITGLYNAAMLIYKCTGTKGYFRGLQARVLFQMPATAISWSVYEFFKYYITINSQIYRHGYKPDHSSALPVACASSIEKEHSAATQIVNEL